jgi:hypothetical protein
VLEQAKSPPEHSQGQPARRPWPLLVWVLPDIALALLLTGTLALPILLVAGWMRASAGGSLYGDHGQILLSPPLFFAMVAAQNLAFATVALLRSLYLARRSPAWLGLNAEAALRQVSLGLATGLLFLMLNVGLSAWFSSMGVAQNQSELYPLRQSDLLGQILIALAGTLLAPLGEELFFRGYVYGAARESLGMPGAILLSSALFALAHAFSATEGLAALLIPVFLLGLLLALVREWSGSLLPCLVAHMLNNGVGLTLLLYCTNNPGLDVCKL